MKLLKIQVAVKDNKIATKIETKGYSSEKMENQLELLGIMENLKDLIKNNIKKLADLKR